jgi:hypothetical protein
VRGKEAKHETVDWDVDGGSWDLQDLKNNEIDYEGFRGYVLKDSTGATSEPRPSAVALEIDAITAHVAAHLTSRGPARIVAEYAATPPIRGRLITTYTPRPFDYDMISSFAVDYDRKMVFLFQGTHFGDGQDTFTRLPGALFADKLEGGTSTSLWKKELSLVAVGFTINRDLRMVAVFSSKSAWYLSAEFLDYQGKPLRTVECRLDALERRAEFPQTAFLAAWKDLVHFDAAGNCLGRSAEQPAFSSFSKIVLANSVDAQDGLMVDEYSVLGADDKTYQLSGIGYRAPSLIRGPHCYIAEHSGQLVVTDRLSGLDIMRLYGHEDGYDFRDTMIAADGPRICVASSRGRVQVFE